MPDNLLTLGAAELAARVRAGLDTQAPTRTYLQRIQTHGARTNAITLVNPDAEADAARATPDGLLAGVPVLVKDNIDVAGMPTTAGSALMRAHVPDEDAPLTARLRAAGAVILGKANLTEWANFMTVGMPNGYSSGGGQVLNPWRAGHDVGGSSSGSGAAVADRLAPIAVGTETSGSILSPAHQNGVYGLKPTVGLIPRTGIVPIASSQDTAGPLGRSARDCALLAQVMQGPDERDPATAGAPTLDFLGALNDAALQGARIGVVREPYFSNLTDAERDVMERGLAALRAAGATVVDVTLDTAQDLEAWRLEVLVHEFKRDLNAYLAGVRHGPRSLRDVIDGLNEDPERLALHGATLLLAAEGTRGDLSERLYTQARARDLDLTRTRGLDVLFTRNALDAVLFPKYLGCHVGAKAGYPSVAVPVGTADGVPCGFMLTGPAWSDARLLAFAHAAAPHLGAWTPAPDASS
ncbi:amidase family protein [Deinococcus maricopensis]|uniref:Amidase n=1 Tax=Deinococcus maricopensis (strain DSM 21211 / LMG 22137 / NRRL B-23946 / LB-34) TaxID=709986 RepID=E8U9B7_DEIML|nr:amidase family protein [Deinococcus maricopensis]ADV67656.1 Amidase [Deinococcus maricopensis DSM 21211]